MNVEFTSDPARGPEWRSVSGTSREIGMPVQTLYKWIRSGSVSVQYGPNGRMIVHRSERARLYRLLSERRAPERYVDPDPDYHADPDPGRG